MSDTVTHWGNEAATYQSRHQGWRKLVFYELNQRKRLALQLLQEIKANSILDIGCGTGELLSEVDIPRRFGVDPAPQMADKARQTGAEITTGYVRDFQGHVDVATALGVVGLVPDLDAFFRDCSLVADHLVFTYGQRHGLFSLVEAAYNGLKPASRKSEFRRYTRSEIDSLLGRHGFRAVKRLHFGFYSNVLKLGPLKFAYIPVELAIDALPVGRRPLALNAIVWASR